MVTIKVPYLIDFVADIFGHAESSSEEARRVATYLTTANLTGHDSHGVIRVPVYMRWKKMGSVIPNQTAEVVVDTPSLAVVDGKFGYGQTVAPVIVQAVFRIISEIRRNTTVLLVEQNARMGLSVADHGYVLETGRIVLGGKPDELWGNEAIRAAYLGGHAKVSA